MKGRDSLNTRVFADTGKEVSEIGFGAWQLANKKDWKTTSEQDAIKLVHKAIDLGCTLFDTAPGYGLGNSEKILGEALLGKREGIVLNTKFGHHETGEVDFNPERLRSSVENSLKRLKTDYLDSILLHNPPHQYLNGQSPHYEVLKQLKKEGKILAYGASVDSSEELFEIVNTTDSTVIEVMFNVFHQEPAKAFKAAKEKGVSLIIKVPLDSGWLSGKYDSKSQFSDIRSRWTAQDINNRTELLEEIKGILDPNRSLVHHALQFILAFPEVTSVIPGAKSIPQLEENMSASQEIMPIETVRELQKLWQSNILKNPIPW